MKPILQRTAALVAVGVLVASCSAPTATLKASHHRTGSTSVDSSGINLSVVTTAWTSPPLNGQLYGKPLEATGRVFVATENDVVYALAADTGHVLWATTVGTPVPSDDLPCGDITPNVGITSTPVVDTGLREIFVVDDELDTGTPAHELIALDLYTGVVLHRQDVDPPGAYTPALLQRVALTLDDHHVVFGFGGNDGDCSSYHGWVVSVPESGGPMADFEVDNTVAGESQGAVWMGGGAPVIDADGNVWVSAGNGSITSPNGPYDDSDSVLKLSSSMKLIQYYAPSTWYSDNASDYDLGSSPPALLANGMVFEAGKSHNAYLMNRAALGGIGGQVAMATNVCSGDVDGGDAVSGSVVFAPCGSGLEAFGTSGSPPSLSLDWQTSTGANGPPIVAGGLVWSIGDGTLFGLDPASGEARVKLPLGSEANHFPTPSTGAGLLLAPTSNTVVAFEGPRGLPRGPTAPTGTTVATR